MKSPHVGFVKYVYFFYIFMGNVKSKVNSVYVLLFQRDCVKTCTVVNHPNSMCQLQPLCKSNSENTQVGGKVETPTTTDYKDSNLHDSMSCQR